MAGPKHRFCQHPSPYWSPFFPGLAEFCFLVIWSFISCTVQLGPCCFEVASLGRREDLANVMLLLAAEKTTLLLRYVDFPSFAVTAL